MTGYCENSSRCLTVSLVIFVRFISFWVPALVEVLVMAVLQPTSLSAHVMIPVCAVLQSMLAFAAGARYMYQIFTSKMFCCMYCDRYKHNDDEIDSCCAPLLDLDSIVTGSHLTFILPAWIITNLICSWVLNSSLVWWSHLLCYIPFASYGFGLGVGYAWAQICKNEYESIPA